MDELDEQLEQICRVQACVDGGPELSWHFVSHLDWTPWKVVEIGRPRRA